MGENGMVERTIAGMSSRDPEAFRQAMWSDEWLALGMKAFKSRLEAEKRDAVRLYFESLGAVSSARDAAIIALLAALELRDMTQLHAYVALARQSEGATEADAVTLAEGLLLERVKADPDYRRRLMQKLFGVMDATPPAALVRANGNGAHA